MKSMKREYKAYLKTDFFGGRKKNYGVTLIPDTIRRAEDPTLKPHF